MERQRNGGKRAEVKKCAPKKKKSAETKAIDTKIYKCYALRGFGVLAKLVIALACHAGDRGFEPRTSRLQRGLSCEEEVLFYFKDFFRNLKKLRVYKTSASLQNVCEFTKCLRVYKMSASLRAKFF